MSAREFLIAEKQGYDFAYNTDPQPWDRDATSAWQPYVPQAQADVLDALAVLQNNPNIAEVSVKVSDNDHYVCARRMDPRTVRIGQVRVLASNPEWGERQLFVSDRVRRMFEASFEIVTGGWLQGRRLPHGLSVHERLQREDAATRLQARQSSFLVTRSLSSRADR